MKYNEVLQDRRSIRVLKKDPNFDSIAVEEMIKFSISNAPSGYNMQASRIILLLDEQSNKFWNKTCDILSKDLNEDRASKFRIKMDNFKNGNGTVLFFEDISVVDKLKEQLPLYAGAMDEWSTISQGIIEYIVWTGFTNLGLAASLQHYNPVVDQIVQDNWGAPKEWKLYAQMPFGLPDESPLEKKELDYSIRFMTFG